MAEWSEISPGFISTPEFKIIKSSGIIMGSRRALPLVGSEIILYKEFMSHFNGLGALKALLTIGISIIPCTGIELDVSPVPVFLRL